MSSGNSYISDVKSGTEPEEGHIREIMYATVLLMPAMKSVLRSNELLILRLQNNRDRTRPLRLEVADFAVHLLAEMLSAQFRRIW